MATVLPYPLGMRTPEDRNRLAALRTKHRRQGIATLPNGAQIPWQEALQQVAQTRAQLDAVEVEAITAARVAGMSWDRISVALGGRPTGEGLRQKFGALVKSRSHELGRR